MRDVDSRSVRWVWWVWWICPGPNLCLSPKVSVAWNAMTRDTTHHTIMREVTVYESGLKQPTNIHQTHQTNCKPMATGGTARENFRTVVSGRKRQTGGHRAVPPAPIRMRGGSAHGLASVGAAYA